MKGYRKLKLCFLGTDLEHRGTIGIMLLSVIKIKFKKIITRQDTEKKDNMKAPILEVK